MAKRAGGGDGETGSSHPTGYWLPVRKFSVITGLPAENSRRCGLISAPSAGDRPEADTTSAISCAKVNGGDLGAPTGG